MTIKVVLSSFSVVFVSKKGLEVFIILMFILD
jgi:hypothetical protein